VIVGVAETQTRERLPTLGARVLVSDP
jgi:hypothetical protein